MLCIRRWRVLEGYCGGGTGTFLRARRRTTGRRMWGRGLGVLERGLGDARGRGWKVKSPWKISKE